MRFDHLIGTIKETITEGRGGMGIASRPTPPTSTPLAKPAAPTPRPAAPPPTGGATFGGGMVKPNSGPTAADKLKAVNSGQHQSAPRVDGMNGKTASRPQSTMGSSQNTQMSGGGINANAGRTTQTKTAVASSTQTKPTATSAPKPTPLQKASASAQAQKTKQTQVKRPIAKPRPMKRPTRTTASDDFNSNMQRSMGNLEEHRTLIETVKKLAKKKNSKCDTEEGDNPKGAPDGFELNPTINSSIQNR